MKEVIGNATLYLGDCLEILPTLDKVDAVITDPPYGIDWIPRINHQEQYWVDDKQFDPTPFLDIGEQHLFWGANYFCRLLPHTNDWFTWMKRPSSGFEGDSRAYSMAELAWSDFGCRTRVKTHVWDGGKRAGTKENRDFNHPSQKPVEIMEWCVRYSEGCVFDPFMGSGTTGVACMNLGRKFIGIEIEPKYFDIACERIEQAQKQMRMFA